jgi:hypothetical protein
VARPDSIAPRQRRYVPMPKLRTIVEVCSSTSLVVMVPRITTDYKAEVVPANPRSDSLREPSRIGAQPLLSCFPDALLHSVWVSFLRRGANSTVAAAL